MDEEYERRICELEDRLTVIERDESDTRSELMDTEETLARVAGKLSVARNTVMEFREFFVAAEANPAAQAVLEDLYLALKLATGNDYKSELKELLTD